MKNPQQKCFEVMLKKPLQMDQNLIFLWLFKYISVKINLIVINFHAKFCLSIKYFLGLSKISTNSLKKESCGLKFNFCSCFFSFSFLFPYCCCNWKDFQKFFFLPRFHNSIPRKLVTKIGFISFDTLKRYESKLFLKGYLCYKMITSPKCVIWDTGCSSLKTFKFLYF